MTVGTNKNHQRNLIKMHRAIMSIALCLIIFPAFSQPVSWEVNEDLYTYSMTAIIEIHDECNAIGSENDLIAVFDFYGTCRGVTNLIEINGEFIGFLTAYSNHFYDVLSIRFYDSDAQESCIKLVESYSIIFDPTTTIGSFSEPLLVTDCKNSSDFDFSFENQSISAPETSYEPILIESGHSDTISCNSYSFQVVLPEGSISTYGCQKNLDFPRSTSGAARVNFHGRDDFLRINDKLLFKNHVSGAIVGCSESEIIDGYFVFNFIWYHEDYPVSDGMLDVEFYSSQLDTVFTRFSLFDINSSDFLGTRLNPITIDLAPIRITQDISTLTIDLLDHQWEGSFCIEISAEDCRGEPCIDLLGNDCSTIIGNSDQLICFNRDIPENCEEIENRIGFETQNMIRAEKINSIATIKSNIEVHYFAGQQIILNPGFEVEIQGQFIADIVPCPNN